MCGIAGLTSSQTTINGILVSEALYKMLSKLEYRGYDSVGAASLFRGKIIVKKGRGCLDEVEARVRLSSIPGNTMIGHTRWATHGRATDSNAHPHVDCRNSIAIVHNGVIGNYREIKDQLKENHRFRSETDTEIVAHLIEEYLIQGLTVWEAFKKTISDLKGSYAIAAIISHEPRKIFFAKKYSPLILGLGRGFNLLSSDITAILEYTRRIIVVGDEELGYITPHNIYLEKLNGGAATCRGRVREVSVEDRLTCRAGYTHYMAKEIYEQPSALANTLRELNLKKSVIRYAVEEILGAEKIFIAGAGTSYHAGLTLEYYLNTLPALSAHTFVSSEYQRYRRVIDRKTLLIVFTQSGETMDTLMAARMFKASGGNVIAITNVEGSAITRLADVSVYTKAGFEVAVASTKTFTAQVLTGLILASEAGRVNGRLSGLEADMIEEDLKEIPRWVHRIISEAEEPIRKFSRLISEKRSVYFLGRGLGVPISMEASLKLKEVAYIHSEAYPAGESKHGPIALVEDGFPVFFVVLDCEGQDKIFGNISEMKARRALTLAVYPESISESIDVDYGIAIFRHNPLLSPISYTPIFQLLAYHTAVRRGVNPDKPRNLAKTVTVE